MPPTATFSQSEEIIKENTELPVKTAGPENYKKLQYSAILIIYRRAKTMPNYYKMPGTRNKAYFLPTTLNEWVIAATPARFCAL